MNDSITVLYNIVIEGREAQWRVRIKYIGADSYSGQSRIYGKGVSGCLPAQYHQNRRRDHRGVLRLLQQKGRAVCSFGGPILIYDGRYRQAHESFESLPMEKQPEQIGKMSSECMYELLGFSCEHMDEFYLILKCSEGTKYASMINDMVELEVESTNPLLQVLFFCGFIGTCFRHLVGVRLLHTPTKVDIHPLRAKLKVFVVKKSVVFAESDVRVGKMN